MASQTDVLGSALLTHHYYTDYNNMQVLVQHMHGFSGLQGIQFQMQPLQLQKQDGGCSND